MSRTLVIHVGAQKCASSSLQASLRLVHQALKGRFGFCFLNPAQLRSADVAIARQKGGRLRLCGSSAVQPGGRSGCDQP